MRYHLAVAAVVAVVLCLRALFRKHLNPRWVHVLWLAVLLRLLLSFSLPVEWKVLPPVELPPQVSTEKLPSWEGSVEGVSRPVGNRPSLSVSSPGVPGQSAALPTAGEKSEKLPTQQRPLTWEDVKGLGTLLLALWFGVSGLVFWRSLYQTRRPDGTIGILRIYRSAKIHSPCLAGPIPAVYLPASDLPREERELILRHEYCHFRRLDPLWSLVRIVVVCLFWYNPALWIAAHYSKLDGELACDEAVCSRFTKEKRLFYANTLVNAVQTNKRFALPWGGSPMKERIRMLTENRKRFLIPAILVALLTLCTVGCSLLEVKPVPKETQKETETEDVTAPIPTGEIFRDVYEVFMNKAKGIWVSENSVEKDDQTGEYRYEYVGFGDGECVIGSRPGTYRRGKVIGYEVIQYLGTKVTCYFEAGKNGETDPEARTEVFWINMSEIGNGVLTVQWEKGGVNYRYLCGGLTFEDSDRAAKLHLEGSVDLPEPPATSVPKYTGSREAPTGAAYKSFMERSKGLWIDENSIWSDGDVYGYIGFGDDQYVGGYYPGSYRKAKLVGFDYGPFGGYAVATLFEAGVYEGDYLEESVRTILVYLIGDRMYVSFQDGSEVKCFLYGGTDFDRMNAAAKRYAEEKRSEETEPSPTPETVHHSEDGVDVISYPNGRTLSLQVPEEWFWGPEDEMYHSPMENFLGKIKRSEFVWGLTVEESIASDLENCEGSSPWNEAVSGTNKHGMRYVIVKGEPIVFGGDEPMGGRLYCVYFPDAPTPLYFSVQYYSDLDPGDFYETVVLPLVQSVNIT